MNLEADEKNPTDGYFNFRLATADGVAMGHKVKRLKVIGENLVLERGACEIVRISPPADVALDPEFIEEIKESGYDPDDCVDSIYLELVNLLTGKKVIVPMKTLVVEVVTYKSYNTTVEYQELEREFEPPDGDEENDQP